MAASNGGRGSPWAPVPSRASTSQAASRRVIVRGRGRPGLAATRSMIGTLSLLQDREVRGGVAGKFVGRAEQQHAARVAADFEVAGDDEAVARVVAFAAQDDDRAVDAEPLQHVDAAAAGVFHQHQAGDAVLVDRAAIDRAALLAGEERRIHVTIVTCVSVGGHAESIADSFAHDSA